MVRWDSRIHAMSDVLPVQSGHRGDPLKARIGARLLRRKRSAFKPKGVVFDPFTNQTEGVNAPAYTPYEIIKMVLMTPTAIARMVIFSRELLCCPLVHGAHRRPPLHPSATTCHQPSCPRLNTQC